MRRGPGGIIGMIIGLVLILLVLRLLGLIYRPWMREWRPGFGWGVRLTQDLH